MSAVDIPDVFSVEEAAAVLNISRGKAYELARLYLTTNGAEGLPVKAFGRCFRVPRAGLEQMLGGELRSLPRKKASRDRDRSELRPADAEPVVEAATLESTTRPRARRASRNDAQLSLFDLPGAATPDSRP